MNTIMEVSNEGIEDEGGPDQGVIAGTSAAATTATTTTAATTATTTTASTTATTTTAATKTTVDTDNTAVILILK